MYAKIKLLLLTRFTKRLQDVLQRSLQDIFKMNSRCLQDVLKMYHQHKTLFLLTRLQEIFRIFSRCIQQIFQTYRKDKYLLNDLLKS